MVKKILVKSLKYLTIFQSINSENPNSISKKLGINYFFLNDYILASKKYNIKEVVAIIRIINKYDLKSKGIGFEGNSNNIINQLVTEIIS